MQLRANVARWAGRLLPRGDPLPPDVWHGRHRGFVMFLWVQAAALAVFGVVRGFGLLHSVGEGAVVAVAAVAASLPGTSRSFRAVVATLGLITSSAILVHLSGGTIEAHFHFFVMVALITLYQEWVPFLLSIAYVVLHHGIMGTVDPDAVYNHPAAIQSPFKWAAIHGAFVLGASVAGLIVWKRNEELRHREQIQVQLNRSLDSFSSRVAHDLKNPLAAIRGAATTAMIVTDEDDDAHELLKIIDRHANRAHDLVQSLLELARARGEPKAEVVELAGFVREIALDFHDLDVSVGRLPDAIFVDPVGLRQVLSNLFSNAQRYAATPDGRAKVHVYGKDHDEGWTIVVADEGPGVASDETTKIFDALTRGANAPGHGAGLGLSIVAAVAEAHEGRAWYQRRDGGGSEFCVLFPRAVPESRIDAGTEGATGMRRATVA